MSEFSSSLEAFINASKAYLPKDRFIPALEAVKQQVNNMTNMIQRQKLQARTKDNLQQEQYLKTTEERTALQQLEQDLNTLSE